MMTVRYFRALLKKQILCVEFAFNDAVVCYSLSYSLSLMFNDLPEKGVIQQRPASKKTYPGSQSTVIGCRINEAGNYLVSFYR